MVSLEVGNLYQTYLKPKMLKKGSRNVWVILLHIKIPKKSIENHQKIALTFRISGQSNRINLILF